MRFVLPFLLAGLASGQPVGGPWPLLANPGLWPQEVAAVALGPGRVFFFTARGVYVRLCRGRAAHVLALRFPGGSPRRPRLEGRRPGRLNFFSGPPAAWRTALPTWARLRYPEVWPGVDLVFTTGPNGLELLLELAPGSAPHLPVLRWEGVGPPTLTPDGALVLPTSLGPLRVEPPRAFQGGQDLPVQYALEGRRVRFHFPKPPDPTRPLLVDPAFLATSGFVGGWDQDEVRGLAVDRGGNVYVTGTTASLHQTFPVRVGPDLTFNGRTDAFVAKVKADGTTLLYAGYIGGSGDEDGNGVAVDPWGRAYVVGETDSPPSSFPVRVGPDLTPNGGTDAFVARLSPDGSRLEYCGYLGGSGFDLAHAVAVTPSGEAVLVGATSSTEQTFPVKNGPFLKAGGGTDAFVAQVRADGKSLRFAGFLGGTGADEAWGVALGPQGRIYVAGATSSTPPGFPVRVGPDLRYHGLRDGFVARLRADGKTIEYCGYIGGTGLDEARSISVDASGRAIVGGFTSSDERSFPVRSGPDLTFGGVQDGFVARVAADGKSLEYCGYAGGSTTDRVLAVVAAPNGVAHAVGQTWSADLPLVGAFQTKLGGGSEAFAARVAADGRSFRYLTYLGGILDDRAQAAALARDGSLLVGGETWSQNFPVRVGPDPTFNSPPTYYADGFVARLADLPDLAGPRTVRVGTRLRLTLRRDPGDAFLLATGPHPSPPLILPAVYGPLALPPVPFFVGFLNGQGRYTVNLGPVPQPLLGFTLPFQALIFGGGFYLSPLLQVRVVP